MRKIFLIMTLIFTSWSCSQLSKNLVKEGEFSIDGGVYHNKKWDDKITFKRSSWYNELTLLFDLMVWKIEESSPFFSWFSLGEQAKIRACSEAFLTLTYQWDSKKISKRMLITQWQEQGLQDLLVPQFESHFRLHPSYTPHSLDLYTLQVFCRTEQRNAGWPLKVEFPGYGPREIKPE